MVDYNPIDWYEDHIYLHERGRRESMKLWIWDGSLKKTCIILLPQLCDEPIDLASWKGSMNDSILTSFLLVLLKQKLIGIHLMFPLFRLRDWVRVKKGYVGWYLQAYGGGGSRTLRNEERNLFANLESFHHRAHCFLFWESERFKRWKNECFRVIERK